MEKITRKIPKGNLGLGVGIASLVLSGCILTYGHNQSEEELAKMQDEANKVIEISETLKEENESYKVKVSEMKESLKTYETEIIKHKKEQEKLKNEIKEQVVNVSYDVSASNDWITYTQTHYTSYCNTGCTGKTASGIDVSKSTKYNGMSIIAVDTRRIPLGSIVEINDNGKVFKAIALDTGGAIKGNKIDLLVSVNDSSYAYSLGVKKVKVKILRRGWDKA